MTTRAALLGILLASCGETPLLELKLVTPDGPDPIEGVDRLRLLVTEPPRQETFALDDSDRFSIELELEVHSAVGSIVLEGFSGETLVARGETPPMVLRPTSDQLALLVARAGALSRLRPRLGGSRDMTSVLLPSSGVLFAGGVDAAGRPLESAHLYDIFSHQLLDLPTLPAPRAGALAGLCGTRCAVVATGSDGTGLADQIHRYDPQGSWTSHPDNLSPAERRRDAAVAPLGDGTYLVIGGQGILGPLDTVLLLDPGSDSRVPSLRALAVKTSTPRVHPAVAVSEGVVLLAGGQREGSAAELLFTGTDTTFHPLKLPGPAPAGGAAAVDLGDGRLSVVGGRDQKGELVADGWIIQPGSLAVTHLPGVLAEGRANHQMIRVGGEILVVGGVTAAGLAPDAEVLQATDLGRKRLVKMVEPREGSSAVHLGRGSVLVAGGMAGAGPATSMEVYETREAM